MSTPRVIVVGAGGISDAWFPPLQAEGVPVVAVVDLRREAAEKQVAKWQLSGTAIETELAKALRDHRADFLLDLTVPEAHCAVTCAALEAGLHVLGEKPMAATMDQARQMVAAAARTGKMYMVSQSRRWDSNHATVARAVAAGAIGPLTTLNCDFFLGAHFGGFRAEMPSPLILDMAIHHFDLARMFAGGATALSVYAEEFNPRGSWYHGDAAANCLFEMNGGLRLAYRGSWCAEGCLTSWNGDWRIVGERGSILYAGDQAPTGQIVAAPEGFLRPFQPAPISPVTLEKKTMHGALAEMLAFLRDGTRPQTPCDDNIHSLAMVFAAMASARAGRRVIICEI